jgi:hypothetical protein
MHLECDQWVVGVAIGVVSDQKSACLFVSVPSDQPTGALWKEKNDAADKAWAHHLQPEWKAPVHVRVR